jgi:hypothetical protein
VWRDVDERSQNLYRVSDFLWKKEDFEGIKGVGMYGLYAHAIAQLYLQAYGANSDLGSSFVEYALKCLKKRTKTHRQLSCHGMATC